MNPTPSQPERPEDIIPALTPLTGTWRTRCCVCGIEYENGCGSTECCGSLQEIIEKDGKPYPATRTPAPEAVVGERKSYQEMFTDDVVKAGDEYWSFVTNEWLPADRIGLRVHPNHRYRRPIPTPPVEADKDAEIAPIEKAAELCGWERVPAAGPTVWHLKGHGFTITKDLPYSLRDQLTTARATIAERDQRIETLEWALDLAARRFDTLGELGFAEDCDKALTHAAEVKEQA